MSLPSEVHDLLETLLIGVRAELGEQLVGLYTRGSRALGDFDPATSDVDVLGVIEAPLNRPQFSALAAMHGPLSTSVNRYARDLEMVYFDRTAAHRFVPGQRIATLGRGESLAWVEHGTNWVVERWTVREHGIVLAGPDPRTLIDTVTPEELIEANRARIQDWAHWLDDPADGAWEPRHGQMAYVVETMCRCRCAIATGTIASKPQAVAWAADAFPEPWRSIVRRSRGWRGGTTIDTTLVPEVQGLVRWAASV